MTAPFNESIAAQARNATAGIQAKNTIAGSDFAAVRPVNAVEEAGRLARIQQEAAALSIAGVKEAEKIAEHTSSANDLVGAARGFKGNAVKITAVNDAEIANAFAGIKNMVKRGLAI